MLLQLSGAVEWGILSLSRLQPSASTRGRFEKMYFCFNSVLWCGRVAFCNEKCESASWQRASDDSANGHAYECSVFGLVCGGAGMGKLGHLAYRTVCRTPLEDMMQTCCGSSLEDNVFRVASYASAHALTGMSEERNLEDLVRRGAAASVLLRCLHKAGFFQVIPRRRCAHLGLFESACLLKMPRFFNEQFLWLIAESFLYWTGFYRTKVYKPWRLR